MSASISTTSETLVVSIETDRGKLHNQADCWLLDVKGGAGGLSFVRVTGGGTV